MNVQIKASDEAGHRVLRETNRKRPACMRKAGKQQYAQRQKKMELFYIILFFTLILVAALRVIGPIAVVVWGILFK